MTNADDFLSELSELCRKHSLGLAGTPLLFRMERDDFAFDYSLESDGSLVLGHPNAYAGTGTGRDAKRGLDADASAQINQ